MKIIALVNQKGGVAKTTTAINLSSSLAKKGKKVLLVDMDPQANLSQGVSIQNPNKTTYDILKKQITFAEGIKSCPFNEKLEGKLDIIPSNINLANAELELSGELGRETLFKEAFEDSKKENSYNYDYMIIDCNPSLGLLTVNALCIAEDLIIPLEPSFFALDGLEKLVDVIKLIRKKLNSNLRVRGVLLTRVDGRTNIAKDFERELKDIFGDKLFNTVIHQNVTISEAQTEGLPINLYNKKAKGTKEYKKLAEELINIE